MSEIEMYVNGERVQPPTGHVVMVDSDMQMARVFLGRKIPEEIPGGTPRYERHPIKLDTGAKLEIHQNGWLIGAFVERGGVAVDPAEMLRDG